MKKIEINTITRENTTAGEAFIEGIWKINNLPRVIKRLINTAGWDSTIFDKNIKELKKEIEKASVESYFRDCDEDHELYPNSGVELSFHLDKIDTDKVEGYIHFHWYIIK